MFFGRRSEAEGALDMRERMRRFDGLMTGTGPTGVPVAWLIAARGEGYRTRRSSPRSRPRPTGWAFRARNRAGSGIVIAARAHDQACQRARDCAYARVHTDDKVGRRSRRRALLHQTISSWLVQISSWLVQVVLATDRQDTASNVDSNDELRPSPEALIPPSGTGVALEGR